MVHSVLFLVGIIPGFLQLTINWTALWMSCPKAWQNSLKERIQKVQGIFSFFNIFYSHFYSMLIGSVTQSMQESSKETNLAQKHQWFFIFLSLSVQKVMN